MTALLASEMPNASHLVKDDQSPVASSFRSPAMAFADRAVVMNGGRIEQIGMPRAKREPSPNQSVALVVPRGGIEPPTPAFSVLHSLFLHNPALTRICVNCCSR